MPSKSHLKTFSLNVCCCLGVRPNEAIMLATYQGNVASRLLPQCAGGHKIRFSVHKTLWERERERERERELSGKVVMGGHKSVFMYGGISSKILRGLAALEPPPPKKKNGGAKGVERGGGQNWLFPFFAVKWSVYQGLLITSQNF